MSERKRNHAEEQARVRVAAREQFNEAVEELFRTGLPIEAPSLETLAPWGVDEGRPKLEWLLRDRPLVKLHYVFNVEQTEGLQLRPLAGRPGAGVGRPRAR